MQKVYDVGVERYDNFARNTAIIFTSGNNESMGLNIELLNNGEPFVLQNGDVARIYFENELGGCSVVKCGIENHKLGKISCVFEDKDVTLTGEIIARITVERAISTSWAGFKFFIKGFVKYPREGITPHIGENGNWWIDEEDTGCAAQGEPGAPGEKGTDGEPGPAGADGKSAYEIAVRQGFEGAETEWLDSITTIVEGENILNRSAVAVSGEFERRAIPKSVYTKVKFMPTEGDIDTIDENGDWVCPKSGVYSITANFGTGSATAAWYSIFVKSNVKVASSYTSSDGAPATLSCVLLCEAGDVVDYRLYTSVAQSSTSNPSNFTIVQNTSINLNTWDLYEQWKEQGPDRESMSFDDFAIWISQNGGM